jgi:hypothetical protein
MILLARDIDKEARALRKQMESEVDEPEQQAYQQLAKAAFALFGTSRYPDATFTPRLAFGQVKGYREAQTEIAPMTTLGGAFAHEQKHGAKFPWILPASWHNAEKDKSVRLQTPLNFVSTADITGGNSGSPVVNQAGELVGLIFDSNIQGCVTEYRYEDKLARAVSVASPAILEALRGIYKTDALLIELQGNSAN